MELADNRSIHLIIDCLALLSVPIQAEYGAAGKGGGREWVDSTQESNDYAAYA